MREMWMLFVVLFVGSVAACQGEDASEGDAAVADDVAEEVDAAAADADAEGDAAEEVDAAPPPTGCNGYDALCGRSYDAVSYATTHNAMSSQEDRWLAFNHKLAMHQQLADGVRGLMLDVHYNRDPPQPYLCHGPCTAGNRPLVEALEELRVWLEANPREVVTIIFETYIEAEDMRAAFEESGLMAHVYAHPGAGEAWPTLEAMIEAGTRLVVFTDRDGGAYGWYHDVWAHAFETHWSAQSPEDLSCDRNRGEAGNALFILNHFLSDPLPLESLAEQVNHSPYFEERARSCEDVHGQIPNFVTVDFYSVGDLFAVVNALNGVE